MTDLDKLISVEAKAFADLKNAKMHFLDVEKHAKAVEFHWNSKHAEPGYDDKAERQQVGSAKDKLAKAADRVWAAQSAYEKARDASAAYIRKHSLGR